MKPDLDILIIGGGQAGIPLAFDLARKGFRIALAERKHLGGSCINFGCTPTKAAITSARVAHLARRGKEFGLRIPTVEVDFPAVICRARALVLDFRRSLEKDFNGSKNPKLLAGHARIEGRAKNGFLVRIGAQPVTAGQIVLDTGTRSAIPPIPGLDSVDFIHAGNWLQREELPERLAIIGGGYIGLEMAQFYLRMGSRVTVIEGAGQVAGHEDSDVASELQKLLESDGTEFRLDSRIENVP